MEVEKRIVNHQLNEKEVPEYAKEHNPYIKYTLNENFLYTIVEALSTKWCPAGQEGKLREY